MPRYELYKIGNRTIAIPLSFDEALGRDAFAYLITLVILFFIFGIVATILPALLFIIYFFTDQKFLVRNNIIGFGFSLYFLIDYHNGWICFNILTTFFDSDAWLTRFATLNLGLLITNIVLLVVNILNRNKEEEVFANNPSKVIAMMLLSVFISSTPIKMNLPSKYVEPPKTEEEKKIEHNQMY